MARPYRVHWTIDILAARSPLEAAKNALEIQRDRASQATVFNVRARNGRTVRIDAGASATRRAGKAVW